MGNCISSIFNQHNRDEESILEVEISPAEIFEQYEHQIIQMLPMDDITFLCMLRHHTVVPKEELDVIESQLTESDRAAELCNLIHVDLVSYVDIDSLMKLLEVMRCFHNGEDEMHALANTIYDDILRTG